jgi:hypothetical protein
MLADLRRDGLEPCESSRCGRHVESGLNLRPELQRTEVAPLEETITMRSAPSAAAILSMSSFAFIGYSVRNPEWQSTRLR